MNTILAARIIGHMSSKLSGVIHKRRRNFLRGEGGGSQFSKLQDIRRKGLGKSGLKFRHGEGGYQKWPKNSDVFYVKKIVPII